MNVNYRIKIIVRNVSKAFICKKTNVYMTANR